MNRGRDIELAVDLIRRQRGTRPTKNSAQLRTLRNPTDLTAFEFCALFDGMGVGFTEKEQEALEEEYRARGGYSVSDARYLSERRITDQSLRKSTEDCLLTLSQGKPSMPVRVLAHHLIRAGTTYRLSLDEINAFCEFLRQRAVLANAPTDHVFVKDIVDT